MPGVFKSATSVHLVPLNDSTDSIPAGSFGSTPPPKERAAVLVPEPPELSFTELKSATSVQLTPFHSSVTPRVAGGFPPKAKASV